MRKRALMLCMAFGLASGAFSPCPRALADEAKATMDEALQEHVRRGIAAYRKNDFPGARQALLEAVRIRPERSFVGMLADVEMRLKLFRNAAEHWTLYLSLLGPDQQKPRAEASSQLGICRTHVGSVQVRVQPLGTQVLLDGEVVDMSPGDNELWLEPGTYALQARSEQGSSEPRTIEIRAGEEMRVTLMGPKPTLRATELRFSDPEDPATMAVPAGSPPAEVHQHRTYVLVGGAILTAVAAGLGTTFWVLNRSAKDDAEAASRSISNETNDRGTCSSMSPAASCDELRTARDRMDRTATIGEVSLVAAGVLGAATIGTYLLWPRSEQRQQSNVSVAPHWSPRDKGISVKLAF